MMAFIVYFSLLSAPPAAPVQQPFWDKHLHFVAYAGLALAFAYATVRYRARPVVRGGIVIGSTIVFGLLIELVQGVLPGRYFGWGDLLANCLGGVLVSVWFLLERHIAYVRVTRLLKN
jgi:VanZ family protein